MEIWRGAAIREVIGRGLGPDAIVVGRPGRPSPSWMAGLPFGPDQFFLGGAAGMLGASDLPRLLEAMLAALPLGVRRVYHYDPTWATEVEQVYSGAGFCDFVHRFSMVRALPTPPASQNRLRLEALGADNQDEFFAAYRECLVDCLSPMSLEDARDPQAALRFQMAQQHGPGGRRWILGRTERQEIAGIALLDRYGPARSDWVVTFLGTTAAVRGQGYGKEMLLAGAQQALQAGARTLHLAVCQTNTPAVSLYRRAGFRTRETYRVFRREI